MRRQAALITQLYNPRFWEWRASIKGKNIGKNIESSEYQLICPSSLAAPSVLWHDVWFFWRIVQRSPWLPQSPPSQPPPATRTRTRTGTAKKTFNNNIQQNHKRASIPSPPQKNGSCGLDDNRSSAVATVASTGFTSMGLLRTMRVGDKGLWFGEAGEAGSSCATQRWLTWLHHFFTGFPQWSTFLEWIFPMIFHLQTPATLEAFVLNSPLCLLGILPFPNPNLFHRPVVEQILSWLASGEIHGGCDLSQSSSIIRNPKQPVVCCLAFRNPARYGMLTIHPLQNWEPPCQHFCQDFKPQGKTLQLGGCLVDPLHLGMAFLQLGTGTSTGASFKNGKSVQ